MSEVSKRRILGDRLQDLRDRQGLSRKALSQRSGLSTAAIYYLEKEAGVNPEMRTIMKLAHGLGVPPVALLGVQPIEDLDIEGEIRALLGVGTTIQGTTAKIGRLASLDANELDRLATAMASLAELLRSL